MTKLPTGTVTLLMTDIEGSTRLWEVHPSSMPGAIRRHHEIVHEEIERHGGIRPADQGEGDSVLAAFDRASGAVSCALHVQRRLVEERWPEGIELKVRIALHTGDAELRDSQNYVGSSLNRTARLRSLANGGQVLVSRSTYDLVRDGLPDSSSLRDLGSHRLKDLTEPEQIFQLIHPDLPENFPPIKGLDQLLTNLPVQLTSLIGREREISEVKKLLSANRLVAITGAAGCGKTRLGLQTAADIVDDFTEGVWFVDLAPVTAPDLVVETAATAMGLRLGSDSTIDSETPAGAAIDPLKKLIEHIRSRRMLIILDNCEHLVASSAEFADRLLRACPNLHLLATSREPLGVGGEATYRVPSLDFPDAAGPGPLEEMAAYDSVRLFVERASLVLGSFTLTPDNAAAVAQIVGRLGGIPLAIELAAARVKALTPEQIASRLDDQFRLLTGGQRTALERQQTIRGAIDWSHQLLDKNEQVLLRRLSVFSGGFDLEAAEAVCGADGLEVDDVLDLLEELVDKSLVVREERGPEARYRMLETIRQYGREKLLDAGESSLFRARHRDYFLALAETAGPGVESPDTGKWLEVLEGDLDNLRAAIEWSLSEDAGAEKAQRMAASLRMFWQLRGRSLEGHRWLEQAISKAGEVPLEVKAEAMMALAAADVFVRGDLAAGRSGGEEALRLANQAGLDGLVARSKTILGWVSLTEGDLLAAEELLREALELGQQADEPPAVGQAQLGLLQAAMMRGDLDRARLLSDKAVRYARELRRPIGIIRTQHTAGRVEEQAGNFPKARLHYEDVLAAARQVGDQQLTVRALGRLTRILEADGEEEQAKAMWEEACAIARRAGEAYWMYLLSLDANERGDYRGAQVLAEDALQISREIGEPLPIASCLNFAAWNAYLLGDLDRGLAYLREAVEVARKGAGKQELSSVLHSLGEVERVAGGEARPLLEESLKIAREIGVAVAIWAPLWSLGELARTEGDIKRSVALHLEALSTVRGSQRHFVLQSLESVGGLLAGADAEEAARLFGAAHALRSRFLAPRPPVHQPTYEVDVAAARKGLTDDGFDKAWEEGESLSLDEAVAFAIKRLSTLE
ncbi:MAG: tetratricopeptide repeat protein [Actinobacteria bacterium]|nr:tetratricopeptide repeat protein [Actinomycetota bacterium]